MKLLFAHQFPLSCIGGVTVMLAEIMRLFSAMDDARTRFVSFSDSPETLIAELDREYYDSSSVFGLNMHIEVRFESSLALLHWCQRKNIPLWVYVFDYWPHHRKGVIELIRGGAQLLASTRFIQDSLAADGFPSPLATVGIPLPEHEPDPPCWPWPGAVKTFASSGRLGPRKRFPDIARAYRLANFGGAASLYLRLLPSHVFGSADDADQLRLTVSEISHNDIDAELVRIDTVSPGPRPFDYAPFFAYICASSYEGFSMAPVEAAYSGCPPLMSDIPAHRAIADMLFGDRARDFLFPMGDADALARMMRDEAENQQRRKLIGERCQSIRETIRARWSLAATVRTLAALDAAARTP